MRSLSRCIRIFAVLLVLPSALAAQSATDTRLRVYLDCPTGGCDRNFFVTELPFALWTQDRLDADVHLLLTRITTGAGGGEYTMTFIGQRRFAERTDTIVTFLPPNSTDDMRRRELARIAKIGLAPLAARLPGGERFSVRYDAPVGADSSITMTAFDDPWNFWVYRLRANGSGNSESRSSSYEITGGLNASRVTEDWKITFNAQNEYRANRFELSDSTERRFFLRGLDAGARVVRSVTEHWSVGGRVAGGLSEFRNQDAFGQLDLSAEWNYYPWKEATSRQLIALVAVGSRYFDYREVTIYGLGSEHRPIARAVFAGESRQTWGTIDASVRYTKFLHDADVYSASFNGRTTFRITRGLSLELRGEATKVNDQLYLPRGDATDDQVLTRQRALATAFRLNGSVGISFTFGSIYNTIVNPRLDDLGQ
jgi:hypothetical protein